MPDAPLVLRGRDARLAASVALPDGRCRASVAALHPADDPSRRQFLFEHLARVLPGSGVAVLRYDRRAAPPGRDVPYELQAEDLAHGLAALAEVTGPVPTGIVGFQPGCLGGPADRGAPGRYRLPGPGRVQHGEPGPPDAVRHR